MRLKAMSNSIPDQPARTKKQAGRPRLLTTEKILDVAIDLGLDGLTMTTIADRLGVSIGMLYGYITNRDELIKLAEARIIQDYEYPVDTGQHWTVYMAENAVAWFRFFTGPGEFLVRYIGGRGGPAAEIDRFQYWIAAMEKQGFEPLKSLLLQRQLGEIVMGGVVTELRTRALEGSGRQLSTALVSRGMIDSGEGQVYMQATKEPVWHLNFISRLRETATQREESFDSGPVEQILRRAHRPRATTPMTEARAAMTDIGNRPAGPSTGPEKANPGRRRKAGE